MPQISLTDFVDIVSKSGRPKATKVRQVKDRPDYAPTFDFYKALRDHLADLHRSGGTKAGVADVLATLTDPKKIKNYPDLIAGYKKWWGKKDLVWFNPPKNVYSSDGFDIVVNPELGLVVNGERHIIKLYLKSDALTTFKTEIIIDLMEHQLRSEVDPTDKFGVLNVRGGKLFAEGPHVAGSMPIVRAEIAYIASIWTA